MVGAEDQGGIQQRPRFRRLWEPGRLEDLRDRPVRGCLPGCGSRQQPEDPGAGPEDRRTAKIIRRWVSKRGLGEDESFFTADVPVGIYVDEVYIARQTGALFDLYDVDRIEVLRGPQGTLFGRNTTAGAIQLISKRPDPDKFGFDADLTVGDFDRRDARATVNVPIVDGQMAARFSAMTRNREGWSEDVNSGRDVNDQEVWGARASLRWQPGEATDPESRWSRPMTMGAETSPEATRSLKRSPARWRSP